MSPYRHYPKKRWLTVVAIVSVLAMLLVGRVVQSRLGHETQDQLINFGLAPVDQKELRAQILEYGLVAYWVGPEKGFDYLLNATRKGEVVVKYIPRTPSGGNSHQSVREVTTFAQVGAFENVRDYPKTTTSLGFINADGNSVLMDSSARFSIYIGVKGKDVQVSIFDKNASRNLAVVSEKGRLARIG